MNSKQTTPQLQQGSFNLLPTGIFTLKEYQTLTIICDTVISNDLSEYELSEELNQKTAQTTINNNSINNSINNNKERYLNELKEYYKRTGSDLDISYQVLKAIIQSKSRSQISDFKTLLSLFSSSGIGFILTGSFSNFCTLPLKQRQKILCSMKSSSNSIRRLAFKSLVPLIYSLFVTVLSQNGGESNPNWEALKYDKPPPLEQIPGAEKLSFISVNSDRSFHVDVVIVGSGAGGGITASILSKAGYKVIVLEKGPYLSPNNMTWKEFEAFPQLYEQGGTLTSDDLSVNILAGSCLGGGTTVNWAASIKTPEHVLSDWRKECPNTFSVEKYQEATEKVLKRLNVNIENSFQNKANELLSKGLTDLDIEQQVIPRNVKGCEDNGSQCGSCSMGCRSRSKQSSTVTYLEDACNNGAQIITNCHVEEITRNLIQGKEHAHGVIGYVTSADGGRQRIFVKANIVVVSAGAIHTPALLLRSRIKNPNIGSNLYLHPVVPTLGLFDKPVEIWKGVPMSVIGKGGKMNKSSTHSTIMEIPNAHIGISASIGTCVWDSSFQFKQFLKDISNLSAQILILRDKVPGKVKLDKDQRTPKITYKLSSEDWENMLPGIEQSLRGMVASGAKQIAIPTTHLPIFESENLDEYIKEIKSMSYKPNLVTIFSAHQMGSCRMGSSRNNSVVNENGESWDVKKLFIADGSVLPSAVGVNPMITIYATSYLIAQSILSIYPPTSTHITLENKQPQSIDK